MALLEIMKQIGNPLVEGNYAQGLYWYLDLTKAFDTINHKILLEKLKILWHKRYHS